MGLLLSLSIFHSFWFSKACLKSSNIPLGTLKNQVHFCLNFSWCLISSWNTLTNMTLPKRFTYLCGMQCILKWVKYISRTNENHKTLTKKHQDLWLPGLPAFLLAASSLLLPAIFKHLHKLLPPSWSTGSSATSLTEYRLKSGHPPAGQLLLTTLKQAHHCPST